MMDKSPPMDDDHIDDGVDEEVISCLDLDKPTSFFLFAGAGSGKTRTLVTVLESLISCSRDKFTRRLSLHGQQIGVVTYTKAARDEIKRRLHETPYVSVSTIHSFAWMLIEGFNADIKNWLREELQKSIEEIKVENPKPKNTIKYRKAMEDIEEKEKRIADLPDIRQFTYSPDQDIVGRNTLSHHEVISACSAFLKNEQFLMQKILISRFPILLIDESQDTNKDLMQALLCVQKSHGDHFCLGLIGDTMQQIYHDGMKSLDKSLPESWKRPVKIMNHRCRPRITRLINAIRKDADALRQRHRTDHPKHGLVRLFILPNTIDNKSAVEKKIAEEMAVLTEDTLWDGPKATVKAMTVEHHMAARRLGFLDMYIPLHSIERLKTGLPKGELRELVVFSHRVLPLVKAFRRKDDFAVMALVKKYSPLLSPEAFSQTGQVDQTKQIMQIKNAIDALMKFFDDGGKPSFMDVLRSVKQSGLFHIPEKKKESDAEKERKGWEEFLETSFWQIEPYLAYVTGKAEFDTHQGVKGLEFPRVMAILDDKEARGFTFSYEKLMGAKPPSPGDLEKMGKGEETQIDRTRRLFYVVCSRAMHSLAVVAYTENPQGVFDLNIEKGWFTKEEIVKDFHT
ncbi:MAG: ATP-dependent helicase [Magnetococcales bacterium]|nr:ATP-dependent helicase [Magnetococcales bacterium]